MLNAKNSIFDNFFIWLSGLIARWSFKILSGVLIAFGVQQDKWEMWVFSALTFIVGWLITMFQNKYLKQKHTTNYETELVTTAANETSVFDNFFIWLSGLIARWSFKILSGVFIALGIQEDKWEMWVFSALTFIIGWLITLFQNKYLKRTNFNTVVTK